MKRNPRYSASVLWFVFLVTLVSCESRELTLHAVPRAESPVVDSVAETLWADAPELRVLATEGTPGDVWVGLKAVYTPNELALQMTWADKDDSTDRTPWVFDEQGWRRLPREKYYEDKAAILWNINNSIRRFNGQGCLVVCHTDKMYTNAPNERGDMWHWKRVRTNPVNQLDDKRLTNDREGKDAGRKPDAQEGGGYAENETEGGSRPRFYWPDMEYEPLLAFVETAVEIPSSREFPVETRLPGVAIAPFIGSRGDVQAKGRWENGVWTLEILRPLQTGQEDDIQFADLTRPYYFGVAVFDNHPTDHSISRKPLQLAFEVGK